MTGSAPQAMSPWPDGRPLVVLVSASVAAGHDGAARAWGSRLEATGCRVVYRDFLDVLPGRLGHRMSGDYAGVLRRFPWLYGVLFRICTRRLVAGLINRLLLSILRRRVAQLVTADSAVVLSTYPLASQVLGQLRARGELEIPVVTFLTDFSAHHLWVSSEVDRHLVLHSSTAEAARRLGARDVRVCGPVVADGFSAARELPADCARAAFGLPLGDRLALLVGGSWGIGEIESAARDIAATGLARPVVVCGHNVGLRKRLEKLALGPVLGWVSDMPTLLRAVDVVVENAGGLSSLEAMAAGRPLLTYRPIPGHGRQNARDLDAVGVSTWVRDEQALAPRLGALLGGPVREAQRSRASALFCNDPVSQLRDLIDGTLAGHSSGAGRLGASPLPGPRWRRLGVAAAAATALFLGHSFLLSALTVLVR